MSLEDVKSILRIAQQEVDRLQSDTQMDKDQIVYLADKLAKVFHSLRKFNDFRGRDMDIETQNAFNSAWRNYEASFDVWQSYYNSTTPPLTHINHQPEIE